MGQEIGIWKIGLQDFYLEGYAFDRQNKSAGLDEISSSLPAGVYTTFRTYSGLKIIKFKEHVNRLEDSARIMGLSISLDITNLRKVIQKIILEYKANNSDGETKYQNLPMQMQQISDLRIRIILPLDKMKLDKNLKAYILVEPLRIPTLESYREGVEILTACLERSNPEAKLTQFIQTSSTIRKVLPSGVEEAVMVDNRGFVREGMSSNFFVVMNSKIYTAEIGVLAGITREIVLNCIQVLGIPTIFEPIHISHLPLVEEAFITSSSSRGITRTKN